MGIKDILNAPSQKGVSIEQGILLSAPCNESAPSPRPTLGDERS